MKSCENIGVDQALKRFGGFVRYYDTTEPLSELTAFVPSDCRKVLACCGGGDQALTILGAGGGKNSLWAVDMNPAQLFVLAAKAAFLKKRRSMPSFQELQDAYPGRIAALKKNIRSLAQMRLFHTASGKIMRPPDALAKPYMVLMEGETVIASQSGPSWQNDKMFLDRVRGRLSHLRFARMDIFDSADHFKAGSLDLIYLSDIFWPEDLEYYRAKLAKLAGLLRRGGRIISYLEAGGDFMGRGIAPGQMLARQAKELSLKIVANQTGGYLVLERIRK
jgi:hypothetical protein